MVKPFVSPLGERLKEERKRLDLSQTRFAELCGVKRTAQTTYESGERTPDADYLEGAGRIGVDVEYVLTGRRVPAADRLIFAMMRVYHHLIMRIGLDKNLVDHIIDEAYEEEKRLFLGDPIENVKRVEEMVDALIDKLSQESSAIGGKKSSSDEQGALDTLLLAQVLVALDSTLSASVVVLTPEKKAGLASMLYRAFKGGGNVDPFVVKEAVKLAAG